MNSPPMAPMHWRPFLDELLLADTLREKVTRRPAPLKGLKGDSPTAARQRLRAAWKEIFVPNMTTLGYLQRVIARIVFTADQRFPSMGDYRIRVTERRPCIVPEQEIWGLTGLAGTGKSALLHALCRALQPEGPVLMAPGWPVVPCLAQLITVKSKLSTDALLGTLANPVFVGARKSIPRHQMEKHLNEWLYQQSSLVSLLDEPQFLTRSESASTLITNLVTTLDSLGPWVLYSFNFSLGHKLMDRPQEDRDRLLANCWCVHPPSADDPYWSEVVAEYANAASGLLRIDVQRDAETLHVLTGGIYRVLRDLLLVATDIAWPSAVGRPISMSDVRNAYAAPAFASHRDNVETLRALPFNATLRRQRKDLVSPLPTPPGSPSPSASPPAPGKGADAASAAVEHMMESAISRGGRQVLKEIRAAAGSDGNAPAKVTPLRRSAPVTAEALLAGAKVMARRAKGLEDAPEDKSGP